MPQVTHDNTTTHENSYDYPVPSGTSTQTFDHEVGVGDGRFLSVAFLIPDNTALTHIKYAGQLMEETYQVVTNGRRFAAFELAAPTEGVNEVEIQFDSDIRQIVAVATNYSLVDQFVPYGTPVKNTSGTDNVGSFSDSVTLEDGGLAVDIAATGGGSTTIELDEQGSQTNRGEVENREGSGFGTTAMEIATSELGGGPGDVTLGWDVTNDDWHWHLILPLRPQTAERQRVYEYHENVNMSRQAGRPRVIDAQGRQIPPEQVRPNSYIRMDGPHFVTTRKYDDAAGDPSLVFVENVGMTPNGQLIITPPESEASRILGRLTRR